MNETSACEQESPFGKAMNQTVDMFKATKVDIKLIEPEVTYKAGWMS